MVEMKLPEVEILSMTGKESEVVELKAKVNEAEMIEGYLVRTIPC